MAGVVRLSSGRLVHNYFSGFSCQAIRRNFKLRERICFHTSSFLNVMGQEVKMPSLSPTMTEGTIVQWLKKEGDSIAPGDVLCEIQTDKAVMSFETEEEGIMAKILMSNNVCNAGSVSVWVTPNSINSLPVNSSSTSFLYPDTFFLSQSLHFDWLLVEPGTKDIKVGTLIALVVAEGEDWKAVDLPGGAGGGGGLPSDASSSGRASSGGSSSGGAASGGTVPGLAIKMPALSPTMTEGTIVAWKKKEGDKISPGDALCEIQTDKAVMTFETEEEGVLAKILVPEGTANVQVGSMIAISVEEGADWKQVQIPNEAGGAVAEAPASAVPAFTGGSVPGNTVNMPSLSPTMTEGQIVNWVKKEGDKISPGDVLCEIQTDKAVMSFETEEEGILAKILTPAGSGPIQVGSVIALTVDEGENWKDVAIPVLTTPAAPPVKPVSAPSAPAATPIAPATTAVHSGYHLVGDFAPAVRALLERYHLTGKEVTPTGRKKRILKGDVIKYVSEHNLQPKPPVSVPLPGQKLGAPSAAPKEVSAFPSGVVASGRLPTGYIDVEISTMRRTIANRLTQSKQEIPHAYSTLKAEIDSLMRIRKQLQGLGIKVSVNDFIVKAVANALKQCPFVNALYVKDQISPSPTVDISIAVATPNGLITPIVKNADQKDLDEISSEVRQLAVKARDGKLQLHEFQGGSFTISNLGMFGIREFSAIINPPQCGILAVGGGQHRVKPDGSAATVMSATLSYDARAMSEDEVAAFMEVLTGYLENPASLLLSGKKMKITSKAVTLDIL